MSVQNVPFAAAYRPSDGLLVLTGLLDDTPTSLAALAAAMAEIEATAAMPLMGPLDILIISDDLMLNSTGSALWVEAVMSNLKDHRLYYKCSALSNRVKYDPRHAHLQTTYFGDF